MKKAIDTYMELCYIGSRFTKKELGKEDKVQKMQKEYDYRKLRGRIREICGTQEAFAKGIGRSNPFISGVLNGKSYFGQNDIDVGAELLHIPSSEIGEYFFNPKVHKGETNIEKERI